MKLRRYEFTSLFNVYVSDEAAEAAIKACFESLTEEDFTVVSIEDKGRFEIQHSKLIAKINLMCCTFMAKPSAIETIKKNALQRTEIIRSMIVSIKAEGSFLDYKRPIEMKKYIFESLRIMPNELTRFSKRTQRTLAQSIKRARILGLIGRFNK